MIFDNKEHPSNKDKVYFCEGVVEHGTYSKYDLYLICDITNPDISLWVYETEIVIIPEEIQITFEIIYGCRSKIGC